MEDYVDEEEKFQRSFPGPLKRRTTWPRILLSINDIIYWEDGEAQQIGEGFFSVVYKFNHHPSGHTVVVKASKDDSQSAGGSEQDQMVMMREIKLLKKLSHPNIIKYFGLCAKEGKFHPVLEYINGGSLDHLLVNPDIPLSWSEKVGFCLDAANGMEYLHANNIFHRDLKSGNCLVRQDECGIKTVVVADFGLAREVAGDTRTPRKMSMVGTTFWMAPELLNGQLYNIKADVFSYGILACEIMARVVSDPDDLPRTPNFGLDLSKFSSMCPGCPEELLQLVKECTEVHNPLSRPAFDEIVASLQRIESTENFELDDVIEDTFPEDDGIIMKRLDSDDNNQSQNLFGDSRQRNSNLSEDSGFDDGCGNCSTSSSTSYHTVNGQLSPLKRHSESGNVRVRKSDAGSKRVSFRFTTSRSSDPRIFPKEALCQNIAPSCGMSLKHSVSLPDLKEKSSPKLGKKNKDSNPFNKTRPKSLYMGSNP